MACVLGHDCFHSAAHGLDVCSSTPRSSRPSRKRCTCVIECPCLRHEREAWERGRELVPKTFKIGAGRASSASTGLPPPLSVEERQAQVVVDALNNLGKGKSLQRLQIIRGEPGVDIGDGVQLGLRQALEALHVVEIERFAFQRHDGQSRVGFIRWRGKEMHWSHLCPDKGKVTYTGDIQYEIEHFRWVCAVAVDDDLFHKVEGREMTLDEAKRVAKERNSKK